MPNGVLNQMLCAFQPMLFFDVFLFKFKSFFQIITRNNFHTGQNQDLQVIDFNESPELSPTSWPSDYQKRKHISGIFNRNYLKFSLIRNG